MDVVARLLHLFPVKKQQSHKETNEESKVLDLITDDGWSPPRLEHGHIRLVLFYDHEEHGKISLYDTKQQHNTKQVDEMSSSSNKVSDDSLLSTHSSTCNSSNSRSFLSKAQSSDLQMFGEMMFGSMPLKLVGNSLKIHYIKSQQQLILTKLFKAHHRSMPTCRVGDFSVSCPVPVDNFRMNSSLGVSEHNGSQLRVPSLSPESDVRSRSSSFNQSLSRPCPSPSASLPVSLVSSYNQLSTSPNQSWTQGIPVPTSSLNSSLTRRLHRARSTSLENATQLYHRVLRPMDNGTTAVRRGKKYAVGLIFSLADMNSSERRLFQEFFFSHFTLISGHLEQLREKIEEALSGRRQQLPELITDAYHTFVHKFVSLYCTERIKAPVWLSVVKYSPHSKRDVYRRFLSEFVSLASELDVKESKFFLSTVLTSVLSLHLAWMFTVSKNGYTTSRHDKIATKSFAVLPETHPYNPLWAQLGDLYGAVTDPLIITRTIITGTNISLIHRLLYVLTYFIRCSEIEPDGSSELKKALFEESDKNIESRAESTVTVTGDGGSQTSNSFQNLRGFDLPLIKPNPFSLGLSSVSNSLRSLNGLELYADACRSVSGHCSSLDHGGSTHSSLKFQGDVVSGHDSLVRNTKSNHAACFDSTESRFSHCRLGSPTCGSVDEQSFATHDSKPKCTCSVDSNDSIASEPATDSGQFSDLELYQKSKDCAVHKPSVSSGLCKSNPAVTHSNIPVRISQSPPFKDQTVFSALSHDKLRQEFHSSNCTSPPSIRLLPSETACSSTQGPAVQHSDTFSTRVGPHSTLSHTPHINAPTLSLSPATTNNHFSSSPCMLVNNMSTLKNSSRNKSWTGLPLLEFETSCSSVPDSGTYEAEDRPISLNIDRVDVEESLSPSSLQMIGTPSATNDAHDNLASKGMKFTKQFQDFTSIDISRCTPKVKKLESMPSVEGHKSSNFRLTNSSLGDFGHSLMAGFNAKYRTDFVLHGTAQPFSEFKDALITDLSNIVKNSIVDLPVQRAAAIVVNTDTLSTRLLVVSKTPKTPDGELLNGSLSPSNSVHEMIQSVSLLWKMHMGADFCLSHLEDQLMELNDKSQMLSSAILEKSDIPDLSALLQHLHTTLNTHPSDQQFLQALASVHCSDGDRYISNALQTSFIHSLSSAMK